MSQRIKRLYLNGNAYLLGPGGSVTIATEGQEIPEPDEAVILHTDFTLERAYVLGMSGDNAFLQEI